MKIDKKELVDLLQPVFDGEGYELVDLEIKGTHAEPLLRFYIYKEGGVTVRNCAFVSREISERLESGLPDFQNCRLEVSSPGIDRPLSTEKDFLRNCGRRVAVEYRDGDMKQVTGKILRVQNQELFIETEAGVLSLALTSVHKVKLKLEW